MSPNEETACGDMMPALLFLFETSYCEVNTSRHCRSFLKKSRLSRLNVCLIAAKNACGSPSTLTSAALGTLLAMTSDDAGLMALSSVPVIARVGD